LRQLQGQRETPPVARRIHRLQPERHPLGVAAPRPHR
jgi:hypothetical protein